MPTPSRLGQSKALKVPERGHTGQWLHGTSWAFREGLLRGSLGSLGVPWTASVQQTH